MSLGNPRSLDVAGAKEAEKKEPKRVGDGGNTAWPLDCQAGEFGLYLLGDGKPGAFSIRV